MREALCPSEEELAAPPERSATETKPKPSTTNTSSRSTLSESESPSGPTTAKAATDGTSHRGLTSWTTDDWNRELQEQFRSCQTIDELLLAGAELWHYRYCQDVWKYSIPAFRCRAAQLRPSIATETIMAVDAATIIYKSWFRYERQPENVLNNMRDLWSTLKPTHFIVAADSSKYREKERHPLYKATREEMPAEFYAFMEGCYTLLRSRGIQVEEFDGLEADDILSSVAFKAQLAQQPCTLVTDDRDMWQSLGAKTCLYSPRTQEFHNSEWLLTNKHITPNQAVDWFCLVGKSDLPSVKGIGPDKASKLLQAFKNIPGIMDNLETLSEKQREHMQEYYDKHYWEVKELHTTSRTCPVTWGKSVEATIRE